MEAFPPAHLHLHGYLHCYNWPSILIEERFHFGQNDSQPLVHSFKVIWKTRHHLLTPSSTLVQTDITWPNHSGAGSGNGDILDSTTTFRNGVTTPTKSQIKVVLQRVVSFAELSVDKDSIPGICPCH